MSENKGRAGETIGGGRANTVSQSGYGSCRPDPSEPQPGNPILASQLTDLEQDEVSTPQFPHLKSEANTIYTT